MCASISTPWARTRGPTTCVETEYMRAAQSLMWLAGFPLSQEYTDVLPGVPGRPHVLAQVLPMLAGHRSIRNGRLVFK